MPMEENQRFLLEKVLNLNAIAIGGFTRRDIWYSTVRFVITDTINSAVVKKLIGHKSISYQIATEWWDEKIDKG